MGVARCEKALDDDPCGGTISARGSAGWICDKHWADTQHAVAKAKTIAGELRRRRTRDTD